MIIKKNSLFLTLTVFALMSTYLAHSAAGDNPQQSDFFIPKDEYQSVADIALRGLLKADEPHLRSAYNKLLEEREQATLSHRDLGIKIRLKPLPEFDAIKTDLTRAHTPADRKLLYENPNNWWLKSLNRFLPKP